MGAQVVHVEVTRELEHEPGPAMRFEERLKRRGADDEATRDRQPGGGHAGQTGPLTSGHRCRVGRKLVKGHDRRVGFERNDVSPR